MINSLIARTFAIFQLSLVLVLMVPSWDARQMTHMLDSEQHQSVILQQHVEAKLAADPANNLMWQCRLFRVIDK